jgi:hypothetical protein
MAELDDDQLDSLTRSAYDENGIDRSMIRGMLARTPEERLQYLEAHVNFVLEARSGRHPGDPTQAR